MGIKFMLKETLDLLNISANQLSVESKIRNNTVYDMVNNKTKRIERENLDNIIKSLNKIARKKGINKKFKLEDVMIWEED